MLPDTRRLSDKLAIPSAIKERAAVIYRKALEQGLVRGRSIAAIAAAALYAATLENSLSITTHWCWISRYKHQYQR